MREAKGANAARAAGGASPPPAGGASPLNKSSPDMRPFYHRKRDATKSFCPLGEEPHENWRGGFDLSLLSYKFYFVFSLKIIQKKLYLSSGMPYNFLKSLPMDGPGSTTARGLLHLECRQVEQLEKAGLDRLGLPGFLYFLSALPLGAFLKSEDDIILFANPCLHRMFGWKDAVIGQKTTDLFPPEVAQRMLNDDRRALQQGLVTLTEKLVDGKGEEKVFETYKFAVPLGNGRHVLGGIAVDITAQKQTESKLQDTLSQVKMLSGLLPICAACKKIRDDHGYWSTVESYIESHSEAHFTHGICPDCAAKLYPFLKHQPAASAPPAP